MKQKEIELKQREAQEKLDQDRLRFETEQQEIQEKLAQEKLRLQHDLDISKRQELLKFNLEKQALERANRMELEKLRFDCESRSRCEEQRTRSEISVSASNSSSNATGAGCNPKKYGLGLGRFDNDESNFDAFVSRFETVAKAYELSENLWAVEFAKTLHGSSLEVYDRLSAEARLDFD